MASFKKFDNQKVIVVSAKLASGTATWKTGDLFSYIPATGVAAKITKASEVSSALGAGYKVFMVAMGDNVLQKLPTDYKTYKISGNVAMSTTAKDVAGYDVTDVTNIDGYAAEV